MDPIIFTPRLKLSLVTKAERGSPELEWLHEICSNEKARWWSIYGYAKSIEETERIMNGKLPTNEGQGTYRVVYAVHKVLEPISSSIEDTKPTEFIGLVTLKPLDASHLALPEDIKLPAPTATEILTFELSYEFLPKAWGKGYATESVEAVFESCKRARAFWIPFEKVFVRAIVNGGNPLSMRVMDKTGMEKRGVFEWTGKVFLAGEWQYQSKLHIFGRYILE